MPETQDRSHIIRELKQRGLEWIFDEVDDLVQDARDKTKIYDGILVFRPDADPNKKIATSYYIGRVQLFSVLSEGASELTETLRRMATPARPGHQFVMIATEDGVIFFAEFPLSKNIKELN